MASSSSHQVFIGFSWTDTRYSFVSHLYAAFRREDITAFESDTYCFKSNDKAIEQAWLSVVVFSRSYASSAPCLDSLVKILKLRRKTGHVVVPVFYGLSRSEVAEQRGSFEEAFTEHAKSYPPNRLTVWRKALLETTRLPGSHESDDKHSDSELVERIVADVREKLYPSGKIGINWRLVEIEDLLCEQSNSVHSLGIWGMGGIGKTTLAEAAFERMSTRYDASCFIQDFDETFREKGAYLLREEKFAEILEGEGDIISSITKPGLFGERLRHKRLLVVLDDVRNPMDAESFLGGFDWFGPGSVVIITSRDKQVLVQCRVDHVYEVKGLSEEEAQQLFSRRVFQKDKPDKAFEDLSRKVIEYASGNPKALSFYGEELMGKEQREMESTLLKLEQHPPGKILDVFKSSYDALGDNEKNIFLDIACFFNGEKIDRVMQLLEGCGFFPRVGIDVLVEKSLVTISENRVEMHNLIRDFGRQMINEKKVQIQRGRRLWETSSIRDLIQYKETKASRKPVSGTEDIEGIFLDTSHLGKSDLGFTVKPAAFENMYNLRLLKIYSSKPGKHLGVDLSKGLKSLPHELRFLHWENYPLESLPQDFDPGNLVELHMPHSRLRNLWGGTKNLAMLRTLRLCHSEQLAEIVELPKARNLELIDLRGCTSLQSFPGTVLLEHLRVLDLSGCTEIKTFPEVPPNLKELNLERTEITQVPESIEKLSQLVKLDLGNCRELLNVPGSIWRLTSLERLNLSGCLKLESFPEISDRVESLEYLDLSETAIEKLPSPIENLTGLRFLRLKNCRNLRELPDTLKELQNVKIECDENEEALS